MTTINFRVRKRLVPHALTTRVAHLVAKNPLSVAGLIRPDHLGPVIVHCTLLCNADASEASLEGALCRVRQQRPDHFFADIEEKLAEMRASRWNARLTNENDEETDDKSTK